MEPPITAEVVAAYAQCPRKAFLLLCTTRQGTPHAYAAMLERQEQRNRMRFAGRLVRP